MNFFSFGYEVASRTRDVDVISTVMRRRSSRPESCFRSVVHGSPLSTEASGPLVEVGERLAGLPLRRASPRLANEPWTGAQRPADTENASAVGDRLGQK